MLRRLMITDILLPPNATLRNEQGDFTGGPEQEMGYMGYTW